MPRGGPDGGDGGRGGAVVLVCDDGLRDLQSFRRKAIYRAGQGGYGEGSQRHGADGQTLTLRVPPGTEAIGIRRAGQATEGDLEGRRWELLRGRPAGGGGEGRRRGQGQQALCDGHQAGAALCRAGPAGRGGLARAAAEAAGGRRAGGAAERGQVLAAGAADAGRAEGGQLPVYDAVARCWVCSTTGSASSWWPISPG